VIDCARSAVDTTSAPRDMHLKGGTTGPAFFIIYVSVTTAPEKRRVRLSPPQLLRHVPEIGLDEEMKAGV